MVRGVEYQEICNYSTHVPYPSSAQNNHAKNVPFENNSCTPHFSDYEVPSHQVSTHHTQTQTTPLSTEMVMGEGSVVRGASEGRDTGQSRDA